MPRTLMLIFGVGVFGMLISPVLNPLRERAVALLAPAKGPTKIASRSRSFFQALREVSDLRSQLKTAEEQNAFLSSQLAEARETLRNERVIQAEMKKANEIPGVDLLPAQVVARSPSKMLEEIVINVGEQDKIQVGSPVISQGFLVGTIDLLGANTSTVQLLTSPSASLPVVLEKSRGQGLLRGGFRGLVVDSVPIDVTTTQGEFVYTSPLGDLVVADIPVGTVDRVISTESEILQRIALTTPVKFTSLEEVLVLKADH
ncbi:rod shape-determining protein MreC [Candidatus Berkelbacteria bacterium]|nr:rod shape-determining protein MreC [Candidatus Berkelbacteria bacterium]